VVDIEGVMKPAQRHFTKTRIDVPFRVVNA
jgi:hypothetical protein